MSITKIYKIILKYMKIKYSETIIDIINVILNINSDVLFS